MIQRLTKEQAAIIGAYTGITAGPFGDIHEYAEKKFGRPMFTSEFGNKGIADELKELSRSDFMSLVHEVEA